MKKGMVSLGLLICLFLVAQTFVFAYEAEPDGGVSILPASPLIMIPAQQPLPVYTPLIQENPPVKPSGAAFSMTMEEVVTASPLGRISEIPTANIDRQLSNRHMPD